MNKKINYANLFFITVIVVGSIVFFMLCLQLINKNKNKHEEMITTTKSIFKEPSKNVGIYKSFYNPAHVGETVIATFYDEKNNKYTDVDITGIRYLSDEEVKEYADSTLKEGFSWYGFEYKIKFNDLANVVSLTNHYIFLFVIAMMILGVFRNRKDIINNESLFFLIMVVVAYFVFLLIEIQPRYLYLIHPSIFILSAYGIEEVMKKIKLKK